MALGQPERGIDELHTALDTRARADSGSVMPAAMTFTKRFVSESTPRLRRTGANFV
jgi:hypothetical protein